MSTGLVKQNSIERNAMTALTEQLGLTDSCEVYGILKNSIMPKATDSDIAAFAITCAQYRLNPFIKEVYAFPTKAGGVQPMVSIDGWLKIAHANPDFNGMSWQDGSDGEDRWCECTVHLKSIPEHPVTVREYMSECRMQTEPWRMRPRRMLRHRATIQAIRYAFGVGGICDSNDRDCYEDDLQDTPKPGCMQMRQAVGGGGLKPAAGVVQPAVSMVPVTTEDVSVAPDAVAVERVEGDAGAAGCAGAFDRLNGMINEAGKKWHDCSRILKDLGVNVPMGSDREQFDKFAAWVLNEKPLMAELKVKLGIQQTLI